MKRLDPIQTRPARLSDVPAIYDLLWKLAINEGMTRDMTATTGDLREAMFGRKRFIEGFVGCENRQVVGVAIHYSTYSFGRRGRHMLDLIVDESCRSRGYGAKLVESVARLWLTVDSGPLEGLVRRENASSLKLLSRLGWTIHEHETVCRLGGGALERLATLESWQPQTSEQSAPGLGEFLMEGYFRLEVQWTEFGSKDDWTAGARDLMQTEALMKTPASNFHIRPAKREDAPRILQFIRALASYEKLLEQVETTVEDLERDLFGDHPRAEVLFVCEGEEAVGYALFFHNYSTFLGKPGIYLEDLFVMPSFRGRGYGKSLMIALAKLAVERGCGRFEWSVLDWNEPSIEFYKSLGAEVKSEWNLVRMTGERLEKLAAR